MLMPVKDREPQIKTEKSSAGSTAQSQPASTRKAYHPSELPEFMKRAIADARVDPKHDHLNSLLDDE
jgi:hypothetical protein